LSDILPAILTHIDQTAGGTISVFGFNAGYSLSFPRLKHLPLKVKLLLASRFTFDALIENT